MPRTWTNNLPNLLQHPQESIWTFRIIFLNISRNVPEHSLKMLIYSSALNCRGQGAWGNCIFWTFSPSKAFNYDPPKLRNFQEIPTPPFNYFMKLFGKTFKCKMKIMGENQMRKLQWTQTIIIILLIQTEQIPTSEQNNQWICKLKKSLNQRRS